MTREIAYPVATLRWLLILLFALPTVAAAKPKVAVAPLDGDEGGKVTAVVAAEAAEHAKVTDPDKVTKAIDSLGLSETHSTKSIKKLRVALEVNAIIYGKVDRDGSKKHLAITVSTRGKQPQTFELDFKSAAAKSFRKQLREELAKRIEDSDSREDDTDDDDQPKKKLSDEDKPKKRDPDEDKPKKRDPDDDKPKNKHDGDDGKSKKREADEDKPKQKRDADEDKPKKKRVADDDERARTRKHSADDDDEGASRKKKHRRRKDDDEDAPVRHPVTQAAAFLDAGAAGLRRTLTYESTGMTPPPRVGTASFSAQLEAEVYPGAFDTLSDPAAGVGIYGSVRKTVGLSIAVPGTGMSTSILQGHYAIGARYRFVFGTSSIALGASYWRQYYDADRTTSEIDMPDIEYTAIAPGVIAKIAATPTVGVFLSAEAPLMMSTGPLGKATSYGQANVIAYAASGGVDVALDVHYGLRFAAMFDQVNLKFAGGNGSQAGAREVKAATDRTIGIAATFALIY